LPLNEGLSTVSFLSRIFGKREDDRAHVRPLWHRVVEIARDPRWYAELGVADTVAGRFDAVTLVLSLVLLRMESDEPLIEPSARLTELFVDDMDGQLRQNGIGDLVVGKHIGRLMGVLGGRLGALREALPQGDAALADVIARNVTLVGGADPAKLAQEAASLARRLDGLAADELLAAEFHP
jgi:cytochrome b pre-mRNA-processing protein 3